MYDVSAGQLVWGKVELNIAAVFGEKIGTKIYAIDGVSIANAMHPIQLTKMSLLDLEMNTITLLK